MCRWQQRGRIALAIVVLGMTSGAGQRLSAVSMASGNQGSALPSAVTSRGVAPEAPASPSSGTNAAHAQNVQAHAPRPPQHGRTPLSVAVGAPTLQHPTPHLQAATRFTPGLNAAALPAVPLVGAGQPVPATYLSFVTSSTAQPLLPAVPLNLSTLYHTAAEARWPVGPYRTTVSIHSIRDLRRLHSLRVTVLGLTAATATVLADRLQLETLALWHLFPRYTDLVSHLRSRDGGPLSSAATASDILTSASTAGTTQQLTDQEKQWWCLDPNATDSNGDGISDAAHVYGLLAWLQHQAPARPTIGPPFSGWPSNHTGCTDADGDSVPDAAETLMLGLKVPSTSTANDRYTDGQKLFGVSQCATSNNGGCSSGVPVNLPSWVQPPYDSPFVAALPLVNVAVVPNSWHVQTVTTITTQKGQMTQTGATYQTAQTQGESTSIANTQTWNNWQEVSQAVSQPLGQQSAIGATEPIMSTISPDFDLGQTVLGTALVAGGGIATVAAGGLLVGGIGACIATIACAVGVGALAAGGAVAGAFGSYYLNTGLSNTTPNHSRFAQI